jgi:hypothetical protein
MYRRTCQAVYGSQPQPLAELCVSGPGVFHITDWKDGSDGFILLSPSTTVVRTLPSNLGSQFARLSRRKNLGRDETKGFVERDKKKRILLWFGFKKKKKREKAVRQLVVFVAQPFAKKLPKGLQKRHLYETLSRAGLHSL